MGRKPLNLSPVKKLKALREADIFHHWDSLDEERYCRRCGEMFTGREIKVFRGWRDGPRYRLECPTEGCPAVPIEWIATEEAQPGQAPGRRASGAGSKGRSHWAHSGIFAFLRVPRVLQ
ncbi:MAG TPA: hypothetical protein VGK72_08830 [Chthoniobacterales bacterium]